MRQTGPVGSAGCEFLLAGESPHQFWAENMAAGALEFLPGLAGDLDGDGDVDEGDTNVFLEELSNTAQGSTRVGDLNGDGVLGIADLVILLQQMGFSQDMLQVIEPWSVPRPRGSREAFHGAVRVSPTTPRPPAPCFSVHRVFPLDISRR